jgi:hypothetical protein
VTPENEESPAPAGMVISAADIAAILHRRGWLGEETASERDQELDVWLDEAAALLGPQCHDLAMLEDLLGLIFHYDAKEMLGHPANHAIVTREGAHDVIRGLATMVLGGLALDSDRYKQVVAELRASSGYQGQKLFYPVRLALAGRAGGGALDRVILLLDRAAALPFRAVVKSNRQRVLEFCAAMD